MGTSELPARAAVHCECLRRSMRDVVEQAQMVEQTISRKPSRSRGEVDGFRRG